MADIKLDSFKNNMKDGARPNRFWVTITGNQAGASFDQTISFFVKTFPLPGRTVGEIVVPFMGMQTKIAGDPTFDDVTMTLWNDYEFKAKRYFEQWLEGFVTIGADGTNTRLAPADYKAEITVEQLGRQGETIATYKLHGAYPKQMEAIELSHESSDAIEEVSISFGYDFFETL